jgi:hypothetical protein
MWVILFGLVPFVVWSVVLQRILNRQRPFNYGAATAVTGGVLAVWLLVVFVDDGRLPSGRGLFVLACLWALGVGTTYGVCRVMSHVYSRQLQEHHEDEAG